MVILSSKTQTEAELVGALEANGLKPEVEGAETVEAEKPAEGEKKTSEQPEAEEEKTEAEGSESADGTEPDEKKTSQEKPQGKEKTATESKVDGEKPKSRGGFQKRVDDLTRQKALVEDQLELERGSKVALQKQLDELNGKLTALQPKEPEKAPELVRPKRPTLKEADFDQDKLDGMLDDYEKKLDDYHATVADKKAEERVTAAEEKRKQETRETQIKAQETAFYERRDKGMKAYEDFGELAEALGDSETIINRSSVVRDYISIKSKDPAHLIHFLMDDFVNNGGDEAERIEQMDGFDQLIAIKEIEDGLLKERGKVSREAPKVVKPAKDSEETEAEKPTPEDKTPAKRTTRTETPDDPITPLGGSSVRAKGKSLDDQMREASEAGDSKKFRELFSQQQREKQAASV